MLKSCDPRHSEPNLSEQKSPRPERPKNPNESIPELNFLYFSRRAEQSISAKVEVALGELLPRNPERPGLFQGRESIQRADALSGVQAEALKHPFVSDPDPDIDHRASPAPRHRVMVDGFTLHAGRFVAVEDRRGLEALCRACGPATPGCRASLAHAEG